jgi:hypothetical protein
LRLSDELRDNHGQLRMPMDGSGRFQERHHVFCQVKRAGSFARNEGVVLIFGCPYLKGTGSCPTEKTVLSTSGNTGYSRIPIASPNA